MAQHVSTLIWRLQKALIERGHLYVLNKRQLVNTINGRIYSTYTLYRAFPVEGTHEPKYAKVLETYDRTEILTYLQDTYAAVYSNGS